MTPETKLKSLILEGTMIVSLIDPLNGKPKHSDVRKLRRVFRRMNQLMQELEKEAA